jgi:hypothetical protein
MEQKGCEYCITISSRLRSVQDPCIPQGAGSCVDLHFVSRPTTRYWDAVAIKGSTQVGQVLEQVEDGKLSAYEDAELRSFIISHDVEGPSRSGA